MTDIDIEELKKAAVIYTYYFLRYNHLNKMKKHYLKKVKHIGIIFQIMILYLKKKKLL